MAYGDNQNDGFSESENELVFHYKKGSFREHESESIRNLATGKTKTSPGLFKSLVSTKGNRFMFFTLIAIVALTFTIGILTGGNDHDIISGANCIVSAFSFEENVYSTLEIKKAKKDKSSAPVVFSGWFEAVNIEGSIAAESSPENITFERKDSVFLRTVFKDYDIAKVRCHISDGKEEILVECNVTRK